MANHIPGILLYSKPNQYTKPSPASPGIHYAPLHIVMGGVSNGESFAVGTHCGTTEFQQSRVDDYIAYKKGEITMEDILLKNSLIFYKGEVNESNWRAYYNLQYRLWFGKDLIDVY